ncbi:MAG: PadR family transcriptional regulator, partial [Alphaproteobacteria bacterium]|nr:PadR family transcriptional regulator [Alphaproteobacteria bacterium]
MDTKTLCLGVLTHGDASGYEIKKALEDGPFGHIQEIGFGSIYPALAKLL